MKKKADSCVPNDLMLLPSNSTLLLKSRKPFTFFLNTKLVNYYLDGTFDGEYGIKRQNI